MRFAIHATTLLLCLLAAAPADARAAWSDTFPTTFLDRVWSRQLQPSGSSVVVLSDPMRPANLAVRCIAPPRDSKVGKADLIRDITPVPEGQTVTMSARFYVPPGGQRDLIILMDLECSSRSGCSSNNPGIRLDLRESYLRVERGKISRGLPIWKSSRRLPAGEWASVRWVVKLGKQSSGPRAGLTKVYLNDELILSRTGVTMPSSGRAVDNWQVGVTANSSSRWAELWVDNVRILTPSQYATQ